MFESIDMKTLSAIFKSLLLITALFAVNFVAAQSLSFSQPVNFLPNAQTDKAFDITNFKGGYFAIWKDVGNNAKPHIAYLGKQYDTAGSHHEQVVDNETTSFAPVLRTMDTRIYALWISGNGGVKYLINNSDSSFDTEHVYSLNLNGSNKLSNGITAAPINGKMMIASHAGNKNNMVFALVDIEADGKLKDAALNTVANFTSSDYPFIVTLSDADVRFCWKGYKDEGISYADYNINSGKWTDKFPLNDSKSKTSPAIYHLLRSERLFYIWKGSKNDSRIYYTTSEKAGAPDKETVLPAYFSTVNPVAICDVDGNNFIMAFAGSDRKLYLSYFANYNPASWMSDVLLNTKGDYTLKDIVIPGSHDAGMSVLTAAGGMQSQTINECNTLTQNQNIGRQLNAGMRMFDLRVGTYQKELHTKHCSSDCMAEAIGGGYGEKLHTILTDIKGFLTKNSREIIILNFSHFCEKETPNKDLADTIVQTLGANLVYNNPSKSINDIKLNELAGKVIVLFERYIHPDKIVDSSSISNGSDAFINWRREYAATNDLKKLSAAEEIFFNSLKDGVNKNDLIRLDWQLTQSADEAALICNDFQSDKTSPIINGAMFLTNLIKKNQSIRDLSLKGNNYLPTSVNQWVSNETINKKNKPNILFVDVAGTWITDYCVDLNNHSLYTR